MIINTPVDKGNESLLWNVSDDIHSEYITQNDIPILNNLPLMSNSYTLSQEQLDGHSFIFIEVNGKLHLLAYALVTTNSSWGNLHYVLENGTWVSKATFDYTAGTFKECSPCVYNNKLIIGYTYASQYADVYFVYDETTDKWERKSYNSTSSGKTAFTYPVNHNNQLYTVINSYSNLYLKRGETLTNVNFIELTKEDNKNNHYMGYNVVSANGYICFIVTYEGKFNCCMVDTSANNIQHFLNTPNIYKLQVVNGNLYGVDIKDRWYKLNRGQLTFEPHIVKTHTMFEYNSNLYCFDKSTKAFQKVDKLYKKATSYATQGTKILSNNSFAISDNLEAIEGGYKVTETGNVEIGIYE